jgi:hypothetical protein
MSTTAALAVTGIGRNSDTRTAVVFVRPIL